MLNSISWQEFLAAIGLAIGLYYAISTFLLYRFEIISIFKQRSSNSIGPHSEDDQQNSNEPNELMGKTRYSLAENVSYENIVASEELDVQRTATIEESVATSNSSENLLTGVVADLLEEIKTVVTESTTAEKEEVVSIFRSLLSLYPQIVSTPYKDSISLLICNSLRDSCAYKPLLDDVKLWWPEV